MELSSRQRQAFAARNPLLSVIFYGREADALSLIDQDPAAACAAACCRGFTAVHAATAVCAVPVLKALLAAGAADTAIPEDCSWQVNGRRRCCRSQLWHPMTPDQPSLHLPPFQPTLQAVSQIGGGLAAQDALEPFQTGRTALWFVVLLMTRGAAQQCASV